MSTTQRVGVAVVALGLLGLGVFLVLGKSEEPQPESSPARVPVVAAPTPTPTAPSEAVAPAPSAPVAVVPTTPPPAETAAPGAPQVDYAPSPFEGADSAELQYATKLVIGENTGPGEWRKAVEVFQRCLDQNPMNHFCKRGVHAAWERIDSDGGQPTTTLTVQQFNPPTLRGRDARLRPDGIQAPSIQGFGE
ncbi:MAG: hypothetical protein ABTQ32_37825 [Myxococcaceae bacterium]